MGLISFFNFFRLMCRLVREVTCNFSHFLILILYRMVRLFFSCMGLYDSTKNINVLNFMKPEKYLNKQSILLNRSSTTNVC